MENDPNLPSSPAEPVDSVTPVWAQEVTRKSVKAIVAATSACLVAISAIPAGAPWQAYAVPVLGVVYVWYSEGSTIAARMATSRLANRALPTLRAVEATLPLDDQKTIN